MSKVYDESTHKRAINLSVNSDLLSKAKELNINLSLAFENTLIHLIKEKQKKQWLQSNKESIEVYNKYVSKNSVFSKGIRSF